ncbi:hypothetical protein ACFXO9_26625 [Nocardia tengchongensis]|uniref:hypothetical protein n=1 Tax=Nocardia tengchongensis TaxID=2055889 RepID=UPI0036855124
MRKTDPTRFVARLRVTPGYEHAVPAPPSAEVLVVGYRACFATAPDAGTAIACFEDTVPVATIVGAGTPMALISVERATQRLRIRSEGGTEVSWEENYFPAFGDSGTQWLLLPVDPSPQGGFVIARGAWSASGYQAVLTCSTLIQAPFAPPVVSVHNADPHTGERRW